MDPGGSGVKKTWLEICLCIDTTCLPNMEVPLLKILNGHLNFGRL